MILVGYNKGTSLGDLGEHNKAHARANPDLAKQNHLRIIQMEKLLWTAPFPRRFRTPKQSFVFNMDKRHNPQLAVFPFLWGWLRIYHISIYGFWLRVTFGAHFVDFGIRSTGCTNRIIFDSVSPFTKTRVCPKNVYPKI